MVTSLDMQLYLYAKRLAERSLREWHQGLNNLKIYYERQPTETLRRSLKMSTASFFDNQKLASDNDVENEFKNHFSAKAYVEGPMCGGDE